MKIVSPLVSSIILTAIIITSCGKKSIDTPTPQPDTVAVIKPPVPVVNYLTVEPRRSLPYTLITIKGKNFGIEPQYVRVDFNGVLTTAFTAQPDQITVEVPIHAQTGKITVTANGYTSVTTEDFVVSTATQTTILSDNSIKVTSDKVGNIYVLGDRGVNKLSSSGAVTRIYTNPNPSDGGFTDFTVDGAGNIYVVISHTRIIKVTPDGTASPFAGSTSLTNAYDGMGSSAGFLQIASIAADPSGNIYVGDYARIRKITPAGLVSTLVGNGAGSNIGNKGFVDGPAGTARVSVAYGMTTDADGNIYIADHMSIRKVSPDGAVVTIAGNGYPGFVDSWDIGAQFNNPGAMAFDGNGNLFLVDNLVTASPYTSTIRFMSKAKFISTFIKTTYQPLTNTRIVNGAIGIATTLYPSSLAFDAGGNLYVINSEVGVLSKITFN